SDHGRIRSRATGVFRSDGPQSFSNAGEFRTGAFRSRAKSAIAAPERASPRAWGKARRQVRCLVRARPRAGAGGSLRLGRRNGGRAARADTTGAHRLDGSLVTWRHAGDE